jgi:group I intron endonuclease
MPRHRSPITSTISSPRLLNVADTQPSEIIDARFKPGSSPWNKGNGGYRNPKNSERLIDKSNPLFSDSLRPGYLHCGVYSIISKSTGKIYIGSSVALGRRLLRHRNNFSKKKDSANRLVAAFIANPHDFEFSVIEKTTTASEAREREQFWINFYQSYREDVGYNSARSSTTCSGVKQSQKTIEARRITRIKNKTKWVSVIQLSLSGEVLARHESLKLAAAIIGGHYSSISAACSGKRKTAYGFKWRYA